jgi:hypothetical protein
MIRIQAYADGFINVNYSFVFAFICHKNCYWRCITNSFENETKLCDMLQIFTHITLLSCRWQCTLNGMLSCVALSRCRPVVWYSRDLDMCFELNKNLEYQYMYYIYFLNWTLCNLIKNKWTFFFIWSFHHEAVRIKKERSWMSVDLF